jgi:predicted ATPase
VRLVTLTGPGGVGKTRLSLAAAAALDAGFPSGVFFVPLTAVRDAEVMWKTLADSLDVTADGPAAEAVAGYLAGRRVLLMLDNLEQLAGAAGVVAALLAAAPGPVVLATSRGPLHVQGEHEFAVPPLEVPGAVSAREVAASAAVRLFAQQAGMVRPGFAVTADNAADVAAICARLDGLPLAIELAASRVRLLAPKALLARLDHSLGLAAAEAGRPLRQQTLRNTVAWSYELLAPGVAGVFRRMSVFAGGADLDALAAVTMADGDLARSDPLEQVSELADVSLITVTEDADSEPRIGLLETIREYALERPEADDDADGARERHAEYYAAVAERAAQQLDSPEHLASLDRLAAEHDNLRALSWSLGPRAADLDGGGERIGTGLRLVQALALYWYRYGHIPEGRRWLERAIDLSPEDAGAPLARLTHMLGIMLDQQGELQAALQLFERSLAISREVGDRDRQALALNRLGITHDRLGHLDTARALFEDSAAVAREIGSERGLSVALSNLGELEREAGNLDRAAHLFREGLALDRKLGDTWKVARNQHQLAVVSLRAGRIHEASEMLSATFGYLASSHGTASLITAIEVSACIAAELGDRMRAARLADAAEAVRQQSGIPMQQNDAALLERFLAPARATVARDAWDAELAAGRTLTQQEALTLLFSTSPAHDTPARPGHRAR